MERKGRDDLDIVATATWPDELSDSLLYHETNTKDLVGTEWSSVIRIFKKHINTYLIII